MHKTCSECGICIIPLSSTINGLMWVCRGRCKRLTHVHTFSCGVWLWLSQFCVYGFIHFLVLANFTEQKQHQWPKMFRHWRSIATIHVLYRQWALSPLLVRFCSQIRLQFPSMFHLPVIYVVNDRELSHMVRQQSPGAQYQENQRAHSGLNCFKNGCCCKIWNMNASHTSSTWQHRLTQSNLPFCTKSMVVIMAKKEFLQNIMKYQWSWFLMFWI